MIFKILLAVCLFSFYSLQAQNTNKSAHNPSSEFGIQEFYPRGGLPNVFYKIATRRQVRIGYIGGSITEANHGWRDLTFSWFQLIYPQTAFYQVDAGVGGTASDLGVFRLEHDILSEKPDLIFVEFAVNDHDQQLSKALIIQSMEGIVRKTWAAFPYTDICFIYATSENIVRDLTEKKKSNYAVGAMEEVAGYYGIPSINLGLKIAQLYQKGKLILSGAPEKNAHTIVFTRDRTHPLPASGYPLYASTVVKYLKEMSRLDKEPWPHVLSRPLDPYHWQNAVMVPIADTHLEGDWEPLPEEAGLMRRFNRFMPVIYKGEPGAVMRFSFEGSVLGIYDCIGPGTGIIDITIDGIAQKKYRFDTYCYYDRKSYFFLDRLRDGKHQVKIRVTGDPLDKRKILARHAGDMANPSDYRETAWYPANVMIIGKLIP